jgi:hypothetical protein
MIDGQVRPLPAHNDLCDHSQDGFILDYSGKNRSAQLSPAMLMQVLQDWSRMQPIYQIFKERFIAHIPQHANRTADDARVYAADASQQLVANGSRQIRAQAVRLLALECAASVGVPIRMHRRCGIQKDRFN